MVFQPIESAGAGLGLKAWVGGRDPKVPLMAVVPLLSHELRVPGWCLCHLRLLDRSECPCSFQWAPLVLGLFMTLARGNRGPLWLPLGPVL